MIVKDLLLLQLQPAFLIIKFIFCQLLGYLLGVEALGSQELVDNVRFSANIVIEDLRVLPMGRRQVSLKLPKITIL